MLRREAAQSKTSARVKRSGRKEPRGRHGISVREDADCLGNREPTIHWKVSRTSADRREGSRKHLSPSAMRSEPVARPSAIVSAALSATSVI
ncbi:MAG: hypothetical protein IJV91_06710 [Kiritimatiellae bacterium]|nr:hypothetical protein [Kiritimatiellia bacterium]